MSVPLYPPAMYFIVFVFNKSEVPPVKELEKALEPLHPSVRGAAADGPRFMHITLHRRDYVGNAVEFGVSVVDAHDPIGPLSMAKSQLAIVIVDLNTDLDQSKAEMMKFIDNLLKDAAMSKALHYELCKVKKA